MLVLLSLSLYSSLSVRASVQCQPIAHLVHEEDPPWNTCLVKPMELVQSPFLCFKHTVHVRRLHLLWTAFTFVNLCLGPWAQPNLKKKKLWVHSQIVKGGSVNSFSVRLDQVQDTLHADLPHAYSCDKTMSNACCTTYKLEAMLG